MSVAAPPPALLTAEEFVRLPEVVRITGTVVWRAKPANGIDERNVPDLAIETRSVSEGWDEAFGRVVGHLQSGIGMACLRDEPSRTLSIFRPDQLPVTLAIEDEFTLPDVLPGFKVLVGKLFT